jgi:hypothetical protein
MEFHFHCIHCGRRVAADESHQGQSGECPACHAALIIPTHQDRTEAAETVPVPRRNGRRFAWKELAAVVGGTAALGFIAMALDRKPAAAPATTVEAREEVPVPLVEIDEDLCRMASAVATPFDDSAATGRKWYENELVLIRNEMAYQALRDLAPSGSLVSTHGVLHEKLVATHLAMRSLRDGGAFDIDVEGVAENLLNSSPALWKKAVDRPLTRDDQQAAAELLVKLGVEGGKWLWNEFRLSQKKADYLAACADLRATSKQAIRDACEVAYQEAPLSAAADFAFEVDASWSESFVADYVYVRNDTGKDLTQCTLFIRLQGKTAKGDQDEFDLHLHYLPLWRAGEVISMIYPGRTWEGFATNQSVCTLTEVGLTYYAQQQRGYQRYLYKGTPYDEDVKRYLEDIVKPTFRGMVDADGGFFDTTPYFEATFEGGLDRFPTDTASIRFKQGTREETLHWNWRGYWRSGSAGEQEFKSEEIRNFPQAEEVELTIGFPESDYKYVVTWNFRPR